MESIKDHYKNLIIGFGKGGKTLAGWLASSGEEVALIEKSKQMYGGTCINVACIPTKSLIVNAEKGIPYAAAHDIKEALTGKLREKNYDKIAGAKTATVIDGTASFLSAHQIKVSTGQGEHTITADRIFINTGTKPFVPKIEGAGGKRVYNSSTLMELEEKPARLAIIGGGFVGLEFADMFLKFGSEVTLFDRSEIFLPKEDRDMAETLRELLVNKGLRLVAGVSVSKLVHSEEGVEVHHGLSGGKKQWFDAVLLATGRSPETKLLGLEAAGIKTDDRGFIQVDDRLQTSAKNVWAIGDVNGGPQFTYISLDDFRIIKNQISGGDYDSVAKRKAFATTVFTTPPYARIGLSEQEAKEQGLDYFVRSLSAANIPKAAILGQKEGLLKAVIEKDSGKILGCMLLCAEAHELINIVQIAINAGLTYETLRDNIYTHPSMAEGFNDLFG
jgi:pyruvate/2-oxoglutarate dehydrogenase complex dihydrolipoamide dehydrogenase (E3) component